MAHFFSRYIHRKLLVIKLPLISSFMWFLLEGFYNPRSWEHLSSKLGGKLHRLRKGGVLANSMYVVVDLVTSPNWKGIFIFPFKIMGGHSSPQKIFYFLTENFLFSNISGVRSTFFGVCGPHPGNLDSYYKVVKKSQ